MNQLPCVQVEIINKRASLPALLVDLLIQIRNHYLKSLDPEKITVIDVTPINNASFKHGYYLESPEFFDDCYMRIFDKEPNTNRRLYLLKAKDDTDYWVLQGSK